MPRDMARTAGKGLRGADSNRRPSGYGPDELPLLYLANGWMADHAAACSVWVSGHSAPLMKHGRPSNGCGYKSGRSSWGVFFQAVSSHTAMTRSGGTISHCETAPRDMPRRVDSSTTPMPASSASSLALIFMRQV